eukprot:gene7304-9852_t
MSKVRAVLDSSAGTPMPDSKTEQPPVIRRAEIVAFALVSLLIITVVAVLYVAKAFFLPIVTAFIVGTMLSPGANFLERHRIPRAISAVLIVTAACAGIHLPPSPADLMLRIVNQMVDGYLDLRRELTRQLDHWQGELLSPRARFNNWGSLLDARISLHQLDEVCEDQRSAIQDWNESLANWEPNNNNTSSLKSV